MKKTNIFMLGLALVAGLSSCEMADEMRGNDSDAGMGALDLAVSVAETVSRADAAPSTDNFEVVITDTENAENTYTYVYSELIAPVSLPVGTYTVAAHTPGEIATQMTEPYYGGSEPLTITQGVTSEVNVVCKMENTKITMSYSDDFKSTFRDWTITLNNGSDKTLTFSNENMTDGAIYWYVGESVATMTMDIRATTTNGEPVEDQKQFTKADADQSHDDDNPNFTGGDFLNINIDIDENEPSEDNRPQISFDINVDLTFGNSDVTVEIPVEDVTEPEEPDQPGDENAPTMEMPSNGHITYTLGGSDQPASADVLISAPNGLKSMNVKIIAGNEDFGTTISDLSNMGLDFVTNGAEMVNNALISQVLSAFLGGASVSAPALGDTTYTFPVGAFFNLMNGFGATAPNAHTFKIVLEDQAGNTVEDELLVTINPAAE